MLVALNELLSPYATAGVFAEFLNAHSGSLGRGEECVYVERRQSFTHLVENVA